MVVIDVKMMGIQHLGEGEDEYFKSPGTLEGAYGVSNTVKLVFLPEKDKDVCIYAHIDREEFRKLKEAL